MDIQIQQKSERAEYRLPPWLRRPWRHTEKVVEVVKLLKKYKLHTVCQSAGCPNISECFEKPTATFMILGNVCTRRCRFCGVPKGMPSPPDPDEPDRIGEVASRLGLKHVVITSVTRDDLVDGGADHFLKTINSVKRFNPDITV